LQIVVSDLQHTLHTEIVVVLLRHIDVPSDITRQTCASELAQQSLSKFWAVA
jgi:hypothetical protein